MTYISFPIETSAEAILQAAYNYIKLRAPGWEENDGNLDTWILQVNASQAADLRRLASDVPDSIFRYFGATLIGLPPIDAAQASVGSTWTMIDDRGYTIPDGTFVGIRDDSGNLVPFVTVGDVVVFSGDTETADGGVLLVAVDPGVASSGLGSVGSDAELIDILDFVDSIVLTSSTSGGVDAEADADYIDRLVRFLRRLSRRPILPEDFSSMALDVAGVWRAVAIDGYNPSDDTYDNPRMITLAAMDSTGADASSGVKIALDALLQANREVNFVVNIMDPTHTIIDVTFAGKAMNGFDPAVVQASAEAAIASYLGPLNWGQDPSVFVGAERTWLENNTLRYFEVVQVLSNAEGMDYLTSVTIAASGDSLDTDDVTLDAPASVTTPGTIIGVVT